MIKTFGASLPLKPHNQFQWNSILQTRSHTTLLSIYDRTSLIIFKRHLNTVERIGIIAVVLRASICWMMVGTILLSASLAPPGGVWSNIQNCLLNHLTCNWSILKRWSRVYCKRTPDEPVIWTSCQLPLCHRVVHLKYFWWQNDLKTTWKWVEK